MKVMNILITKVTKDRVESEQCKIFFRLLQIIFA